METAPGFSGGRLKIRDLEHVLQHNDETDNGEYGPKKSHVTLLSLVGRLSSKIIPGEGISKHSMWQDDYGESSEGAIFPSKA